MYLLEDNIKKIEREKSKMMQEFGGQYLYKAISKIELTERLLRHYREVKFCIVNHEDFSIISENIKGKDDNIKLTNQIPQNIDGFYLDSINQALKRLKSYPKYGSLYYRIIYDRYIGKSVYTYEEISRKLKISKQNVLLKKRDAINILSSLLWESTPTEISIIFAEKQIEKRIE